LALGGWGEGCLMANRPVSYQSDGKTPRRESHPFCRGNYPGPFVVWGDFAYCLTQNRSSSALPVVSGGVGRGLWVGGLGGAVCADKGGAGWAPRGLLYVTGDKKPRTQTCGGEGSPFVAGKKPCSLGVESCGVGSCR